MLEFQHEQKPRAYVRYAANCGYGRRQEYQEREKKGLPNAQVHDTDIAIKTAIEALRILIKEDTKND